MNLGVGIGSFMEGLAKGAMVRRSLDQQDVANQMAQRRMDLAEQEAAQNADYRNKSLDLTQKNIDADNARADQELTLRKAADARATEESKLNLQGKRNELTDYAAGAPVREAKRLSELTTLQDAAKVRKATKDAVDAANKDVAANPGMNFNDAYKKYVDGVEQVYLQTGDAAGAAAYRKAWEDRDFRQNGENWGRAMQSLQTGDTAAAVKYMNDVIQNGKTPSSKLFGVAGIEEFKDDKGNPAYHLKLNVDGKEVTRDINDLGGLQNFGMTMLSPHSALEQLRTLAEQERAAKVKSAEDKTKLAHDVTVETLKGDKDVEKELVKNATSPKELPQVRTKAQIYKSLADNVQGFTELPPDQQAAKVEEAYSALTSNGRSILPNGGSGAPRVPFVSR